MEKYKNKCAYKVGYSFCAYILVESLKYKYYDLKILSYMVCWHKMFRITKILR